MTKPMVTLERLKELLHYDPETGIFTWKIQCGRRGVPGTKAGWEATPNYVMIQLDGQAYKAHRLAWLYMTGDWPKNDIDHINGLRNDNKFTNLRDVTKSVNQQNRRRARKDSTTGLFGVTRNRDDSFQASIQINGNRINLGFYATAEEANKVYLEAKRRLHEGCTI